MKTIAPAISLSCRALILAVFALGFVTNVAKAQKSSQDPLPVFKNSISLNGFILLGSVQVNYERLIGERHGLMAEGYYAITGLSEKSWTVGASYRYHFIASLKGPFANAFFRYGDVHYTSEFGTEGNTSTLSMQTNLNLLGLGIGNRWQWNNGLAAVLRAGYGYQINPTYSWSPYAPSTDDKNRVEFMQGLDLELSIGYSF